MPKQVEPHSHIITWIEREKMRYWTLQDEQDLLEMVKAGIPHKDMAIHLGRSVPGVVSKMHKLRNQPHGA